MITTIVSGGQTGANQAGLRAARKLGLKTAGYMPLGWLTEAGPMPHFAQEYGLVEAPDADYSTRTELNVCISDATVIFGKASSGSNLTAQLCRDEGKPCHWIHEFTQVYEVAVEGPKFRLWLTRNHITTLNVAGNRESRNKGIGYSVERFLLGVLPLCH